MFFSDDAVLCGFQGNHFIVIDPAAPPAVKYAAHQLQEYLRRIGGKVLRIVATDQEKEPHHLLPLDPCIYVGPSRLLAHRHPEASRIALRPEEILVWKQGQTVVLTGGGPRGPLYAVYYFLEKYLGVRFFTSDVESVPDRVPPLPQSIRDRSAPAFEYRDMVQLWRASGDWAVKNRMNGHFANVTDLQGGRVAFFPICHSQEHLMPPARWFKAHPEYYSLIAGERTPRQICLSNPKVQDICTAEILRWIRENPGFDIFGVSENDGGGVCGCDACRKMNGGEATHAGLIMRFVNRMAREVARRYPDKWIETLSYATNRYPPKHLPIAPNVIIRLCADQEIHQRLAAWRRATPNIYIWAYFIFTHYPVLDGIAAAARFFRDKGVKGLFYETDASSGFGGVENPKLRLYIAGKMLWNPDDNPRRHIEEYVQGYYGPAAAEMLAVLDHGYALKKKLGPAMAWKVDGGAWDGHFKLQPFLVELEKQTRVLFVSARAKCRDSVYAARIEEAAVPFQYNAFFGKPLPPRFEARWAIPRDLGRRAPAARKFLALTRALKIARYDLEAALKPTVLTRLRQGSLEVLVLPEVGGRIIQIYHGGQHRPLIKLPLDLTGFSTAGHEEYIGAFFHDPGWNDAFKVVGRGRDFVRLRATVADVWEVEREYQLRNGNELRLATTIINKSKTAREARVRTHPRWEYDRAQDQVIYRTVGGQERCAKIAEYGEMLKAHVFLSDAGSIAQYTAGKELPDGCWAFRLVSKKLAIEHHFETAQVEKVLLVGSGGGYFTEDLVSVGRRLLPGGRFTFRHGFRFVDL